MNGKRANKKISQKSIYFIGIGGIGMSALAQYFKAQNWRVLGSDLESNGNTRNLLKVGINVKIGQKKSHITSNIELIIYNQAIKDDNPELHEAKRRNIPLMSYPEAVGALTTELKTVSVSGAHGKSTTTAMIALTLIKAGLDPTVIIGTRLTFPTENSSGQSPAQQREGNNFRSGKSKNLVLEADEFGRAFLHYSPFAALITNIDLEHLDTYKNLADVKKTFLEFISRVRNGGVLVVNKEDANLHSLAPQIAHIAKEKNVTVIWYSQNKKIASLVKKGSLPYIIGRHNVSNASGAFALAKALGISDRIIFSALKKFTGTWRRLEYRGGYNYKLKTINYKLSVYDDYAHHPTEIKASLAALKQQNIKITKHKNNNKHIMCNRKLICVFQPHQRERLKLLFKDFTHAFADADVLVILPVYKVPGRDEPEGKINSEFLAKSIQKKYPKKKVVYLDNPKNLKKSLISFLSIDHLYPQRSTLNVILVMMGAGDIFRYTELLLKP